MAASKVLVFAVIDDSIEADSIAKSDESKTSRKDVAESALDMAKNNVQQGADTVTNSLDRLHGSAVTAGKSITDPEQAFLLQGTPQVIHRLFKFMACWHQEH